MTCNLFGSKKSNYCDMFLQQEDSIIVSRIDESRHIFDKHKHKKKFEQIVSSVISCMMQYDKNFCFFSSDNLQKYFLQNTHSIDAVFSIVKPIIEKNCNFKNTVYLNSDKSFLVLRKIT